MPEGIDARYGHWFNAGATYHELGDTAPPFNHFAPEGSIPDWDPHFRKERKILFEELCTAYEERELLPPLIFDREELEAAVAATREQKKKDDEWRREWERGEREYQERRRKEREKKREEGVRARQERAVQDAVARKQEPAHVYLGRPQPAFEVTWDQGTLKPVHTGTDILRAVPRDGYPSMEVSVTVRHGTLYMHTFRNGMYLLQETHRIGPSPAIYTLEIEEGTPVRFFTR
jgi:hypothetical protein